MRPSPPLGSGPTGAADDAARLRAAARIAGTGHGPEAAR
jgi:hypothetical protein